MLKMEERSDREREPAEFVEGMNEVNTLHSEMNVYRTFLKPIFSCSFFYTLKALFLELSGCARMLMDVTKIFSLPDN
jgi:hypothetical protein